jgi:hypothetical protein
VSVANNTEQSTPVRVAEQTIVTIAEQAAVVTVT